MNVMIRMAIIFLLGTTICLAETLPKQGITDARVREVVYNKNDVIRLTGYEGYQTHFKFADDEEFIGLGSGDPLGLDVASDGNDTWIRPKAIMVGTNFDLKTNRRIYHFDYQSKKTPPQNRNKMIYAINFHYPEDEAKQRAILTAQEQLKHKLKTTNYEVKNRDYWYCGNDMMKPVEAYDDGLQTHVKFSAYAEFPAIFVENEDKTEALINFHIDPENGEVVIHRIGRRFVLRRGDLVGCIENRQFTGGGKRTTSGTVNQNVVRETIQTDEATAHE